ncbi:Spo0E family sporulation regulatory protein-aspartic acid phosphatase [Peribacillus sp. NPDC060186]
MFSEKNELEDAIKQLKNELILIVGASSLNSNDTILCSQKLDRIINIYQTRSYRNTNLVDLNQ